jgi:type 1 glutamine amidotransferase
MHHILVISSGIFHPPLLGRLRLWQVLGAAPGVSLRRARSIEALARLNPDTLDAVVLYYHARTISPPALEALDRFVREGGGILAVHSATASFKQAVRYTDMLGGRFVSHPPVGPLEIRAAAGADEIFGVIAPFIATDEAYRHELQDDIRVHFVARPVAGAAEEAPLVWTRSHGAGRICYFGAGHCAASLRHPGMVRILQAGLAWVCRAGERGAP